MDLIFPAIVHTFFCSISFAFGQSYTTSFPKTGVVSGLYISSALRSLSFPLSMNSFPLTPKQTVVFFPSNMNVNMSPYWKLDQHGFAVSDDAGIKYLLPTAKEEVVRVNSVGDGTANERNPVKHNWGFTGVFEKKLAEHVDNDGNNKERQEASSEDDGSGFVR